MSEPSLSRRVFRFGVYQCDLSTGELHKSGVKVKLSDQPFRLLGILLERSGEVVTRQELRGRLWPTHSYGDFDDSLNTAINKIRVALDDEAENPRFVETIPRRGYRFLGAVKWVDGAGAVAGAAPLSLDRGTTSGAPARWRAFLPIAAVILVGFAGLTFWILHSRAALSFNSKDSVLISDFDNETGDPRFDQALQSAFTISLEQSRRTNVFPRARIDSVLERMGRPGSERVTLTLGREICLREGVRGLIAAGITRTGQEYELTAELIDPRTGAAVRSYAERSYDEDHVLDALDTIAGDIRRDLGESLLQIHRANKPLPQVTTHSLVALKQFADGRDLWHKGKFDDAMASFRLAVASDPDFAMAHAALGSGYYSYIYNEPGLGKREYEKALSLSSRTTERERLAMQAEFADDQNHIDDAFRLYQSYLESYPDDWRIHAEYAHALRLHNREPEAIEQYEQLLRIAPDDAETYVQIATAYHVIGKFQQAVDAYSRAFSLEPQQMVSGNVDREYGFTLVALGEDDKAIQAFDVMLEKPETQTDGIRSLAMLDLYHGRYAAAEKRFNQVLSIWGAKPPVLGAARVHFRLAVIADGEGNSRMDIQQLDDATAHMKDIEPKVAWGALVGKEFARAGATAKAQEIYDYVAPAVDPRNPQDTAYARILQAEIASSKGDANQALKILSTPGWDGGSGNSVRAVWLESLAHAYQQQGNISQAIHWYETLMAMPEGGSASWEPQQRWLGSYYTLASDYLSQAYTKKASDTLSVLLDRWKSADSGLKLRREMLELQARISGGASTASLR